MTATGRRQELRARARAGSRRSWRGVRGGLGVGATVLLLGVWYSVAGGGQEPVWPTPVLGWLVLVVVLAGVVDALLVHWRAPGGADDIGVHASLALAVAIGLGGAPAFAVAASARALTGVLLRRRPVAVAFDSWLAACAVLAAALVHGLIAPSGDTAAVLSGARGVLAAGVAACVLAVVAEVLQLLRSPSPAPAPVVPASERVERAMQSLACVMIAPVLVLAMANSPWLILGAVVATVAPPVLVLGHRDRRRTEGRDHLTGLANRALFAQVTTEELQSLRRSDLDRSLAILLLDLDRFKEVNDVLGHATGDQVLKEAAVRLRRAVPNAKLISRLGGDEFTVLLPVVDAAEALRAAETIRGLLRQPYSDDDGRLIDIDASIGIAIAPHHGNDLSVLLSSADIAMYAAKRKSLGCMVFRPELAAGSVTRLGVVNSLRRALDTDSLFLEYQPKIDLRSGRASGVEAFLRWPGCDMSPDEFLPAAEQAGLMPEVNSAVLRMACTQYRAWHRIGLDIPIAVNVSMRDLVNPDLAVLLTQSLRQHWLPAGAITLEVSEHLVATDFDSARAPVGKLFEMGITVALDAFGAGWSSLLMLDELPVSEVKLDRRFVRRVVTSSIEQRMLAMIVDVARTKGLGVTAEGVEDPDTLERLAELGCTHAQGWHIARPMRGDAATSWIIAMEHEPFPIRSDEPMAPPHGQRLTRALSPD